MVAHVDAKKELPSSCQPFACIPDVKVRIQAIAQALEGYRSAVVGMKGIAECAADCRQFDETISEMEGYIAALQAPDSLDAVVAPSADPPAPECCAPYAGMLRSGMSRELVAHSVLQHVRSLEEVIANMSVYPETQEVRQQHQRTVDEMREYALALAPDGVETVGDQIAAAQRRNQEMFREVQEMPGETMEEKQRAYAATRLKAVHDKNPLDRALNDGFKTLVERCLLYSRTKYETSVVVDGIPLLQHIAQAIQPNHPAHNGGVEGFAWLLKSGQAGTLVDPESRKQSLALVDEVCRRSNPWDAVKMAVFLVAACLSSASPKMYATKMSTAELQLFDFNARDGENFEETKKAVQFHMEELTLQLRSSEAELRKLGALAMLASLGTEVGAEIGSELRQDAPHLLGRHPELVELWDEFVTPPHHFPGHRDNEELRRKHVLFIWSDRLLSALDEDLQAEVRAQFPMMEMTARNYVATLYEAEAKAARLSESATFQPALLWLVRVARRILGPFNRRMAELFPTQYEGAPVKGVYRSMEKMLEDYSHLDKRMPTAMHLLDLVRGLVVCATPEDMAEAFATVSTHFDVLRVKNSFATDDAPGGFRQILLNVRFEAEGYAMACEIQLNLKNYVAVKHQIHKFYSFVRCEDHTGSYQLLLKSVRPF